jgi:DNA-binding MarR family transcriptional regulator
MTKPTQVAPDVPSAQEPLAELVELMFFAYRDFVGIADARLETYGFGRAHHRALHFIHRNDGLTVTELLDILQITKQSLARVLRELMDQGFLKQKEGRMDRRARHLHLTAAGNKLAHELLSAQIALLEGALDKAASDLPTGAHHTVSTYLLEIINPDLREKIRTPID